MNTKAMTKNADGTFNVVIFSSDNKKKMIFPPAALQHLIDRVNGPGVFCHMETVPDLKKRYTFDKYHTNYPDDIAAKILSLQVRQDGGIVHEVTATVKLTGGKGKLIDELINVYKSKLGANLRAICGPVGNHTDKAYRVIHSVTGIYFTPFIESGKQHETEALAA